MYNRKPVICPEAASICGLTSGAILAACHNNTRAVGKLWAFLEDWLAADKETRAKLLAKPRLQKKRVRCIETDEIFDSIHTAAKHFGLWLSAVSAFCNGKLKSAGGLHFEFVDKKKE